MSRAFGFFVFSRTGRCLFEREWDASGTVHTGSDAHRASLLSGLVFSLRSMAVQMSPHSKTDRLASFSTDTYACHLFEAPSKLKFVLLTGTRAPPQTALLRRVYEEAWVPYVALNPLARGARGRVQAHRFAEQVDRLALGR